MANEGIELEIYRYSSPKNKADTLEGRVDPTFLSEVGDIGGGSFKISRLDPKIAADRSLLDGRNVCKFRVDGRVVGAMILGVKKSTLVATGEASEQGYEVSGEGLKTWFKDARVYPWGGLSRATRDKRSFSFASPKGQWYKAGDWVEPRASVLWTKTTGNPWKYRPTNWPADIFPNARWVWGTYDAHLTAAQGDCYFRLEWMSSGARKCSLYIAADNAYQIYLDGAQIAESTAGVSTNYECQKIDFDVDDGYHVVGIKVNNSSASHAGLLAGLVYYTTEVPDTNLGNITFNTGNQVRVNRVGHGLANDDKVFFSSTGQLPSPLSTERNYYVADPTANSFALQRTKDGPWIDSETAQSGTHTLFKAGSDATPKIISYSGLNTTTSGDRRDDAQANENKLKTKYDNLPAGKTGDKSTKKQQAQAKAKAAAKVQWQKAISVRKQWQTEYAAANVDSTVWKVLPYPTYVPGWSPGEILLRLMSEASARGVLFPSYLTPTFTAAQDSNGVTWGDALEWNFDVGKDSLFDVVDKLEELQVSVWIDPDTYALNMAFTKGVDRASGSDAIVFEAGKNILAAGSEMHSKITNALMLKTNVGWYYASQMDAASIAKYGRIEDVVDTDAPLSVVRSIGTNTFALKSIEEEGATYDIFPTDYQPFVDFNEGDWVSAPNDTGTNVKRRIVSLSLKEATNGRPLYSAEFDTIFHVAEDRLNRVMNKLGQRGVTGGSGAASGGLVNAGTSTQLLPPTASPLIVPVAPENTQGYPAAAWDAAGTSIVSQAVVTWDVVGEATDGNQIIVPGYSVFARPASGDEGDWVLWQASTTNMAILSPFDPGETWLFKVAAQSPYGASYLGDFGDIVSVTMGVPNAPMDPPTPPVVDSKLGVGILKWDGYLKGADGSTHLPDPQFREIQVGVSTVSGGPYDFTKGTPMTRSSPESYVTGYTVGSTIYAVFVAVDGIGIKSDPSAEGQGVLKGVDLGSLQTDVADAIQQAKDAGVAAQNGVTGKITYANADPGSGDAAGHKANDLWYVKANDGNRIANMWRFDGTSWVQQNLGGTFITNLDAGNIVTGFLASDRIQVNSLSGAKITGGTIVGDKLSANTITTNQIAAGAIVTNNLAAGAIDGVVITGAYFRTSNTATNNGVVMDSTGVRGYKNGTQTFAVDSSGNVTMTGTVNATSGSFTGQINATSGTISGTLLVTGTIATSTSNPKLELTPSGLTFTSQNNYKMFVGQSNPALSYPDPVINFINTDGNAVGTIVGDFGNGTKGIRISTTNKVVLIGNNAEFYVDHDGNPRIWSPAILYRTYSGASTNGSSGTSTTRLGVVSDSGTLGVLDGPIYQPDAYGFSTTQRAAYLNSQGRLGTSTSSRRVKNLWSQVSFDDAEMNRWLDVPTWAFDYKADEKHSMQLGLVAEEALEAGYGELVYFNEQDEDPEGGDRVKGQIDGFAYERMGVYNRLAIKRLLERVEALESQLAAHK